MRGSNRQEGAGLLGSRVATTTATDVNVIVVSFPFYLQRHRRRHHPLRRTRKVAVKGFRPLPLPSKSRQLGVNRRCSKRHRSLLQSCLNPGRLCEQNAGPCGVGAADTWWAVGPLALDIVAGPEPWRRRVHGRVGWTEPQDSVCWMAGKNHFLKAIASPPVSALPRALRADLARPGQLPQATAVITWVAPGFAVRICPAPAQLPQITAGSFHVDS